MKKPIALALVFASVWPGVASAQTLSSATQAGIAVRQGPGASYPLLATLSPTDSAAVLHEQQGWYQVRLADGRVGFAPGTGARVLYDDVQQMAVVNTDVLNVRSGPGTGYAVLSQITQGQAYRLREMQGDWWRIDWQGAPAWVFGQYMQLAASTPATPAPPTPPTPPQAPAPGKGVAVVVPSADVLMDRWPGYDAVATVQPGDALTYLDSRGGWLQVQTPDGTKGWLPGDQVVLWDGLDWFRRAEYQVQPGLWQISYLPLRSISAGGAPLRQAAAAGAAAVAALTQGTVLKVIGQQGNWLHVSTADGKSGWVDAASTGAAPQPAPLLQSATLRVAAPGVMRLELTGNLSGASVGGDESTLQVALPDSSNPSASLQVGDSGISALSLDGTGLTLRFANKPAVRTIEQSTGRLVLELRPALQGVSQRQDAAGTVFHLALQGDVQPGTRVSSDGSDVVLTLPGATLGAPALPPGVRAEAQGSALLLHVSTRRSFSIKRVSGGLDLDFYTPALAGKTIMLDPGHGGPETGAISPFDGLLEKDINLDVQLRLKALLEAQGAHVVMTRQGDTRALPPDQEQALPPSEQLRADLGWRSQLANSNGVDLFLSVHSNSNPDPSVNGSEAYYATDNLNAERSATLAGLVQQELLGGLGRYDGGVHQELFYVTRFTDAPACLAELAYLSNAADEAQLASPGFRQQAAGALARALTRFFAERPGPVPTPDQLAANPYQLDLYDSLLAAQAGAGQLQDRDTFVNGRKVSFDVRPQVEGGRTLVPVRALAEAMGARVEWNPETAAVTVTRGASTVQLQVGSAVASVNGQAVKLDVPARIVGGRSLIPLRFVSEQMGWTVTWFGDYAAIVVTDKPLQMAPLA